MISTPTNIFLLLITALVIAVYFTMSFVYKNGAELMDICQSMKTVGEKYHELNKKMIRGLQLYLYAFFFLMGVIVAKLV